MARPFSIIRRQKLISKAKQQARLSPQTLSPTFTMGKTIGKSESPVKVVSESSEKEEKHNTSESEYSSLEDDDDDVQGKKKHKMHIKRGQNLQMKNKIQINNFILK